MKAKELFYSYIWVCKPISNKKQNDFKEEDDGDQSNV